jgi:hypothetical protein
VAWSGGRVWMLLCYLHLCVCVCVCVCVWLMPATLREGGGRVWQASACVHGHGQPTTTTLPGSDFIHTRHYTLIGGGQGRATCRFIPPPATMHACARIIFCSLSQVMHLSYPSLHCYTEGRVSPCMFCCC